MNNDELPNINNIDSETNNELKLSSKESNKISKALKRKKRLIKNHLSNNNLNSRNNKNTELFRINTKLTTQLTSKETKGNENLNEYNDKNYEGQKNEKLVKKITYNKFCFYCFFFCYTKKKTKQNLFLEEGINLVRENLDIISIFKDIYKKEMIVRKCNNKKYSLKLNISNKKLLNLST